MYPHGEQYISAAALTPDSFSFESKFYGFISDCYMLEPQLSNSRKRQRSLRLPGTSQSPLKRQKLSYIAVGSQISPAFWDNLSKIWLTKRALGELDRRIIQATQRPYQQFSHRRPHRPVTRHALVELKEKRQNYQSTANNLFDCAPWCSKGIKLFARHGGPDLSDLRGVRITKYNTSTFTDKL